MDVANLSVFAIAVVMLLLVPGPSMAFVISHGIAHGGRGGFAAALGITLADLIMTGLVSFGVGTLVMSWAPAFELIRWAGAAYLLWLGWGALRAPGATLTSDGKTLVSMRSIFLRATLNSLLNPKALVFFMVFLPQFVDPANGSVAVQMMVLGVVLAGLAFVFHFVLGLCAGHVNRKLRGQPLAKRFGSYGFAAVMAALAARLIFLNQPTA